MKRLALRSMLATAMVTCLLSTTQAGIIPWVYDTIFGPVRYPAYGPVYSAPPSYYSPYRCSPCGPVSSQPKSSCSNGRCSTGGCSTMAYYPTWPIGYAVVSSPCKTACSTEKTDWRATETDRQAPEPREEGKTTFADQEDPFNANKPPQPAEEETPVKPEKATVASEGRADGEATVATEGHDVPIKERIGKEWKETAKTEPADGEEISPGETGGEAAKSAKTTGGEKKATGPEAAGTPEEKPGEGSTAVVAPKVENPAEESSTPAEEKKAPLLGDEVEDKTNFGKNTREGEENPAGEGEEKSGEDAEAAKPAEGSDTKPLEVKPLEEIQNKASWKFSRPARRIAFRASFGNVKITRVSRSAKTDYVIPAASLTRIAER